MKSVFAILAMAFFSAHCCAQTLYVRNSPFAPKAAGAAVGTDIVEPVAGFRFTAEGASHGVSSIVFTLAGTGNWPTDCSSTDGISVYADNRDGVFDTADSQVFAGGISGGTVSATFAPPIAVTPASSVDIWIVIHLLPTAVAASLPTTYSVSIAAPADVGTVAPASLVFASPAPVSADFSTVSFSVTDVTRVTSHVANSFGLTITGTGFTPPVYVTVGVTRALGTVNAQHTVVSGLQFSTYPESNGLPVIVETGLIGPILTNEKVKTKSGGCGGCGCTTGVESSADFIPGVFFLLLIATRIFWRRLRVLCG